MTSSVPTPAERHREYAEIFGGLVAGTTDWQAPTPVPEWTALDVVEHLTTWFPSFVHAGSPYGWTQRHSARTDPLGAWQEQSRAVQMILDDPAQAESRFSHPNLAPCTLVEAVDRFYVADVFMHSWDLARGTGQPIDLDHEYAASLLDGMTQMEGALRASGQYGPAHPINPEAGVIERLMAFIGRDPEWSPLT